MKLMTQEVIGKLKPLYACEHEDNPIAVVKFFCPWNQWTWFAWEGRVQCADGNEYAPTEVPPRAKVKNMLCFGYVIGHENEAGYFSLAELQAIRGPGGLGIERDLSFKPTPLSKIRKKYDR